jgi:hypothetical protein
MRMEIVGRDLHPLLSGMSLDELRTFVTRDPRADAAVRHARHCKDCRKKIAQSVGGRWGEGSKKV